MAVLTLAATVFASVTAVFFGLYPRQPSEPVLDPDRIYRRGKIVGRVAAFNVEPALAGQFVFRIEPLEPVGMGDVLQFRTATCFVMEIRKESAPIVLVTCRVIGK